MVYSRHENQIHCSYFLFESIVLIPVILHKRTYLNHDLFCFTRHSCRTSNVFCSHSKLERLIVFESFRIACKHVNTGIVKSFKTLHEISIQGHMHGNTFLKQAVSGEFDWMCAAPYLNLLEKRVIYHFRNGLPKHEFTF